LAFSCYPTVLAFAACTAIQCLRKEQDLGDQVAVELAPLGRANHLFAYTGVLVLVTE